MPKDILFHQVVFESIRNLQTNIGQEFYNSRDELKSLPNRVKKTDALVKISLYNLSYVPFLLRVDAHIICTLVNLFMYIFFI